MTVPYLYQLQDVRALHRMKGRALLAWEMGLGKTYTSLSYLDRHRELRPAVVVCPASIKYQWEREAAHHFGMRAEVLSGTKPMESGISHHSGLFVLNYDILPFWLDYLKKLEIKIVIIDECQYTAGRTTRRTKAVQSLCKGIPHVVALSGTPLTNRPAELWPILNVVRPDLFPSFWPFAMRYTNPKRTHWGWDLRGASHLGELHKILVDGVMIRRRKADVLSQLPSKSRSVVPLEIENRKEYDFASNDFLSWLAKRNPEKLDKAEKAHRLVQLGYLKRLAAKLKLKSVMSWVDDFLANTDGKLILFGIHIEEIIHKLRDRYSKVCVVVTGEVTPKKRQLAVDQFQKNKSVRIFLGNLDAAGVGWNGTAAEAVAFCEMGWVPAKHTQAEDRAHRIGQTKNTNCYYLVAKGTIETKLVEILQTKQRTLSAVLDGDSECDELEVFDLLTKELLKKT